MDIIAAIKRILKTGKVEYGKNKTINNILTGKAKAVIITSNTPKEAKEDIKNYANQAGVTLIEFPGTSLELGEVCGKPFLVSSLTVLNEGDVDLKSFKTEEKQ